MQKPKRSWRIVLGAHSFTFGVLAIILSFVFLATVFIVSNGETLGPSDSHVVNLYVDGQTTTIPTRAATVKEFLTKANVKLYEADLVEPDLNMPITSDNFKIRVYRARPVTIVDGNITKRVLSPHTSARLIAQQAGFTIYNEDILTLSTTTNFVQDMIFGEKLTIDRATPVTLSLYGVAPVTYRTQATTVDGFLYEQGIVPEAGATVMPSTQTAITADLPIFISKFGKTVLATEEDVDFTIESNKDPNKYITEIVVTQPGVKGKKQVVYEIELRDDVEIRRSLLHEAITVQPITQIQTVGTKIPDMAEQKVSWMQAAGITETDYFFVDYIMTHETHWRVDAVNSIGCIGLGQNCPDRNGYLWLEVACPDWRTNPVCQLQRFALYATGRYGDWQSAYLHKLQYGWW